ncbi:hypothetical protein [Lysinibacillus xylanilyticus]|uniref:Uncharacterized protein n=1 Tax=Lysinibacillus xylanilyticus TaxID=582475 RepID=A0ABV3W022_9BACI
MKIKKVIKNKTDLRLDYYYFLMLEDGRLVDIGVNRIYKVWVVFSKDVHDEEKLSQLFYQMLKSKECIDRLRFVMINPKDIMFLPLSYLQQD